MSKTPVMTDKQKRQTLSAKKKPKKASLKNVLAQPFQRYWPQITDDEARALIIDLSNIRVGEKDGPLLPFFKSIAVKIGLNASQRALRLGTIDVLVISASIRPKYVLEQIFMKAVAHNKNIKIVCIQRLHEMLAETLGFSTCLCFSLTEVARHPQLAGVYKTISNLADRCHIPETFKRPKEADPVPMDVDQDPIVRAKRDLSPVPFEDIYVKKKSSGRSFIPAGTVIRPQKTNDWSDFISLGDSATPISTRRIENQVGTKATATQHKPFNKTKLHSKKDKFANSPKTSYITTTVNKVQANPNKTKKKNKS